MHIEEAIETQTEFPVFVNEDSEELVTLVKLDEPTKEPVLFSGEGTATLNAYYSSDSDTLDMLWKCFYISFFAVCVKEQDLTYRQRALSMLSKKQFEKGGISIVIHLCNVVTGPLFFPRNYGEAICL